MEAGTQDTFFMRDPTLGPLYKIAVDHDGTGMSADWKPELFEVGSMRRLCALRR